MTQYLSDTLQNKKARQETCHRLFATSSNRKLLNAVAEVLQVLCKSMKAYPAGQNSLAQDSVMLLSVIRSSPVHNSEQR